MTKFLSFSEQICGVELEVEFKSEIIIDNTIIGLINARIFHQHIEKEELFAFNIRKFLGMRRKSVNSEIKNTLEDGEKRNKFWLFNNGIVCLCSDYSESGNKETGKKYNTLRFKDFTIVNGAQTISTISKFIEENPAFDEPIWVFAKIIIVEKNDVEKAIELTKTSNTQTPASSRDLRAVDALHKHVSNWFKEYYDYIYLYRRGEKAKKDQKAIKLKDMVQAYFAFQIGKPNLAFANVGKIFSETDLYKEIFDEEYINLLRLIGTEDDKKEFIIDRLIPYLLLEEIRKQVKELTKQDIDNKWKSVVYHILWLYHELIPAKNISKLENLMQNYQLLIEQTIKDILNGIKDFCISKGYDIPRDLKSDQLLNGMKSDAFKQLSSIGEAKRKIAKLLP
ncbi:MAG: AIPR family protein [Candidatus Bathyarchaeia archaeon]